MAIRKLNYTGRRKIKSSDVLVTVEQPVGLPPQFDIELEKLNHYRFPEDAHISVEAYRQTKLQRFAFGTIGEIKPPMHRWLRQFDSCDEPLFRVKVTAVSERPGLLLGEADQVRIRRSEDRSERRQSLLPVRPDHALGEQVFEVAIDGADGPMLNINATLGNHEDIARRPSFMSLVYPAAVRQILWHLLMLEEHFELDEEPLTWRSRWLRFARKLPGVPDLPKDHASKLDVADWIEDVVAAFSRKLGCASRFAAHPQQEADRATS